MKRGTKIVITVATAISLGLAAAAVSAHPSGYGMGSGMMGGYGPGQGMGPQAMYNTYSGNADEGLAALKAELGITAKQDAAWQAFVKNAKQQDENRQAWFAKMHEARSAGSAPGLPAQQTEHMKQRQTEM